MNNRLVKIILTALVIAAGTGVLVYSSFGHASYYKMVDELMVEPDSWVGKDLSVHGYVEAGTIHEEIVGQTMERKFVLEHKQYRIEVEHSGPKPDTFKDLSEVVAKGRIVQRDGKYVLEATELMAKCPSKYEGAERNRNVGKSPESVY